MQSIGKGRGVLAAILVSPAVRALLFSFVATFALLAQAQTGLIARYELNDTPQDAVGTNHGTLIGVMPTTDRFGRANSAYAFNGFNSRIEFFAPPPLNQSENWTVTAWLKPATFSQTALAVYVGLDNAAVSDGFGMGLDQGAILLGFFPTLGGFFVSGHEVPGPGEWFHAAMVRTNGLISFYINGVKAPNSSDATLTEPTSFTIGGQNGIRLFNGSIDDVRIYNRALSSPEILQAAASAEGPCYPHAAKAAPLLAYGFLVAAFVVDGACGYTNAPTVTIVGGGGLGATATATISNGAVTGIQIVSAGCCYTNDPQIVISSPPFPSKVSIRISKFKVTQHVMIGRTYVLQGSFDMVSWVAVGESFTAEAEDVVTEVDAETAGRFFRTREIIETP